MATRTSGNPCYERAAITAPVSLCRKHLAKLAAKDGHELNLAVRNAAVLMQSERAREQQKRDRRDQAHRMEMEAREAQQREERQRQSVVYYCRIGEYIKIGTTTVLHQRMSNLLADELLATEPGGKGLESIRLRQFSDLLAKRREFFRPDDRLMEHIKKTRAKHGEPTMTSYVAIPKPRVTLAVAALGCSVPLRTLRRWAADGRLTTTRKGREYMVDMMEVLQLVEMRDQQGRLTGEANGRSLGYGRP